MNYYIQGDAANADKIRAAFEKILGRTVDLPFEKESVFFYTANIQGEYCIRTFDTTYYLVGIIKTHPDYKELELPIEPCFKVGDKVVFGTLHETIAVVLTNEKRYLCETCREILFEEQDRWHLAPKPHYDISNFKPFDKVLTRDTEGGNWNVNLFSYYIDDEDARVVARFRCMNSLWKQCIPFNDDTKHLLGTTDMPDEMYINW